MIRPSTFKMTHEYDKPTFLHSFSELYESVEVGSTTNRILESGLRKSFTVKKRDLISDFNSRDHEMSYTSGGKSWQTLMSPTNRGLLTKETFFGGYSE